MLEDKIEAAQIAVLRKYGVLADFSGLGEEDLDRVLKGRVKVADAPNMTFARWCDDLIGWDERVPVARFDLIPGQTLLANLAIGAETASYLKGLDRQHKSEVQSYQDNLQALEQTHAAAVRAYKKEIKKLQDELSALRQASIERNNGPLYSDPVGLRSWYAGAAGGLRNVLGYVKEVEGPIFEAQGLFNKDYREQLVDALYGVFLSTAEYGFTVRSRFICNDHSKNIPMLVLYGDHPYTEDIEKFEDVSFLIKNVPPDVLYTLSEKYPHFDVALGLHPHVHFDWEVDVRVHRDAGYSKEELFHFGCFLLKLFEAVAKSGDHRPRGSLREKMILCELLYKTAPCMLPYRPERTMPSLLKAASMLDRLHVADKWDVSAGMILGHFNACLQGYEMFHVEAR